MSDTKRISLDDLSPFPFGKHKGTRMQDVPVHYLHWGWNSFMKNIKPGDQSDAGLVADYIRKSKSALRQEQPDYIWDNL